MTDITNFLNQAEKEARNLSSKEDREAQLARIKSLWENYQGEDRIVTSHELAEMAEEDESISKLSTKWEGLNKLLGGIRYGQLVILSAQEKSGKTTFALQLIETIQEPTCFLFEQNPRELISQFKERGQTIPYFLTPLKNIDNRWEWVEKRCLEAMIKRNSRFFVIDNVDWLQKEYGFNQRTDEVMKDLLLKLKTFCKQWEVVILLVAHVRKMPFQEIPQPDDIKDTAAFKQIADSILILWRKTREEKVDGTRTKAAVRTAETLLWVAENRATGKTGYVQLVFDGKSFAEKTWDANLEASEMFENDPKF